MARIIKRGDAYLIRVSCGRRIDGREIVKNKTWRPDRPMSPARADKEARHQAEVFEEQCRQGLVLDGKIKFADYADKWMAEYAEKHLRASTLSSYRDQLRRVIPALGHLKLDSIRPLHLLTFYDNLEESGIRLDTKYHCAVDFAALLKVKKLTRVELQKQAGISMGVLTAIGQGKNVAKASADKIAQALELSLESVFKPVDQDRRLSGSTILRYHRMLSSMLATAVKWQMIISNPCERLDPPKASTREARYLDPEEAARLLELLDREPLQYRTMITLLLYTGMRRGELCGLEWRDIDFESGITRICRSSLYLPDKGVFVDETKNASSNRFIKLPSPALSILRKWRSEQAENRLKAGDQWYDSGRLFTQWDGRPIHPDTLTSWFHAFVERSGLPQVSIHSLRHTNATLLISGNVDVRTVSAHLGHAQTSTTINIYAHAIRQAEVAAAEALELQLKRQA